LGGLIRGYYTIRAKSYGNEEHHRNAACGLDAETFSGHSLRRGLLTAGADNRAQLAALMCQSGHRSAQSVLGYLEPADLWRNNVTEGMFGRAAADGEGGDPDPA
jgi:integrase